ncbi:hypothetical protein AB4Z54_67705, partial [Streptomyces sp. MCAF7]
MASGWTRSAEAVHLTVTVPPNTTAAFRTARNTPWAREPMNTWSQIRDLKYVVRPQPISRPGPLRCRATSHALSGKDLVAGPLPSQGTT